MSAPSPLADNERESLATTRREWRIQHIAWVVLGLIVALAVGGLFGVGPLSWSEVTAEDGSIEVAYSRFSANGAPSALSVRVPATAAVDGQVRLWISSDYLQALEVTSITPEPASESSVDGGVVLVFDVEPGVALEATLNATGNAIGMQTGRLAVVDHAPVQFWQVFYP